MDANVYQKQAERTLIEKPDFELQLHQINMLANCIRMDSASGTPFEMFKKGVLHRHGFDRQKFNESLLDVWFAVDQTMYDVSANALKERPDDNTIMVMVLWNILGLLGEAGEMAATIMEAVEQGRPIDKGKTAKEAGDLLWYVAAIATKLGLELGSIMVGNIAKLWKRYPAGWRSADSIARVDVVA